MNAAWLLPRTRLPGIELAQRQADNALPSFAAAKRVWILSASVGAGHTRAAAALLAHASGRIDLDMQHLDVLSYVPAAFRTVYKDWYLKIVAHYPSLWARLYEASDRPASGSRAQRALDALQRASATALLRRLSASEPDLVVCTHFLPAALLSQWIARGRLRCRVWVQITDFDAHRAWVQPHIDGYFAASDEVAYRLRAHGVAAHRIHVTGIPVMPSFGARHDRAACARELGIDPQRPTLLLMGGGAGMGGLAQQAAHMLEAHPDLQVLALAGRNVRAYADLRALGEARPGRLAAFPYIEHVERLMACADLAVTKPGGLSVSECLAMGLPMVLRAPIPGQEERNADFLLEHGVALKASDEVTLQYRVHRLLQNRPRLDGMARKARRLGRPDAATRVLDTLFAD